MTEKERIVGIIRKYQEACEQAAALYQDIPPKMRTIPLRTLERKQYAIDAQLSLLERILAEIEEVTS